ncbi:uncharacterized protein LOC102707626 [Oryza brachyantha]|uniref:uncharacterized protein LOC102707626 n=1 Tax=Oryza brachyantha TaxID=4533 RepID=UPI001ADAF64C|nr:uncharacterized protein LOC102707626 [Oryza brachyantha]
MSQQEAADPAAAEERPGELPRSGSSSRLNARAPEFVPRAAAAPPPPGVIRVFAAAPAPPPAAFFAAVPPPPPPPFEYYPPVGGGFGSPVEHEAEAQQAPPAQGQQQQPARDGISDDVVHKITKQGASNFQSANPGSSSSRAATSGAAMAEVPEESAAAIPVHGCSSRPLSFPSQPSDIKNWFSSYEYESPELPELAGGGHGSDSSIETQDPLEKVGLAGHSFLECTAHDDDGDGDAALRINQFGGRRYEREVSGTRDLIPGSRSTVERGGKRKQSLRSLFGDGFLDSVGKPCGTESHAMLPLPDCSGMCLPNDTQEGAIENLELVVGCNGIDSADTQDGSQGGQETEHSRLPIGDSISLISSHTEKGTPKDHNESRFQEDGIQNSVSPINCDGIIISDTHENSTGEEICHGNSTKGNKEHEETSAVDGFVAIGRKKKPEQETKTNRSVADGFVAIRRKKKPEQETKTNRTLKPPMKRENARSQEKHGIVKQKGRNGRSPLADKTNVSESEVAAAPSAELRGKWKCPRKGKPYVGPPLKQLRLEQWVRRGD